MSQSTPSGSASTRQRNKPVLSCTFCRGRKLRCDRESPCSNCVRHGQATTCTFLASEQQRRDAVDYRPHARRQHARQRIARQEQLVSRMQAHENELPDVASRTAKASATTTSLQDAGLAERSLGTLSLTDDDREMYTGGSHWRTILEDIRQIKDDLEEETPDGSFVSDPFTPRSTTASQPMPITRISLLSSAPTLSHGQILAMLPERKVVDRHVSYFFNTFDVATFLHRNTFFAEYVKFWEDTSAAPIMWVAVLYGILSMSIFLQRQNSDTHDPGSTDSHDPLETYRMLTIHCLVAGDYLRPSKYTIEALTLHYGLDQNMNVDSNIGNWMLIGVVIRVALRLGLHRDPSHWPNIKPLQAELRRRTWISLYQMDFFASTQIGLPRNINDAQCDVRRPANLSSEDFANLDRVTELPSEQSLDHPSPLSWLVHRHAIIKVSAEIYDATEAAALSPEATAVWRKRLEDTVTELPSWLKFRRPEDSVGDEPNIIIQRIFFDILVQKAIYILHRRSFIKSTQAPLTSDELGNDESHRLCIDASLSILSHQRTIHEEMQPGGLLQRSRWKIASSLGHDFLQGTMMLCFVLRKHGPVALISNLSTPTLPRQGEIITALEAAMLIWENSSLRSTEAQQAVSAIVAALKPHTNLTLTPSSTYMNSVQSTDFSTMVFGGPTVPFSLFSDTTLDPFTFDPTQGNFSDPSSGFPAFGNDFTVPPSSWSSLEFDPAVPLDPGFVAPEPRIW